MVFENESCPNCECLYDDDCCGGAQAYVMDGIKYCCEECAVDEECSCGCQEAVRLQQQGQDKSGAQPPGPVLAT